MKKIATLLLLVMFVGVLMIYSGCGMSPNMGNDDSNNTSYFEPLFREETANYQTDVVYEQGWATASINNLSSFKLDRNTASYSLMRRQINDGMKISQTSVRVEEFINYFNYSSISKPTGDKKVALSYGVSDCPWNANTKILSLGVATENISVSTKSNNIVLLIDVSGSMSGSDRIGLVKKSVEMLVENMTANDVISVVTYASGTRVQLDGVKGNEKSKIMDVVQNLTSGGSTNGEGGIDLAYKVAEKYKSRYENNRVIIMTDGDFNVGKSSTVELQEFIAEKRASGVYLSALGFGMYNTNDKTMKTLAEYGNGNYGYIDSLLEAKKLLIDEIGGTMVTVAKDAKSQVTFNKEVVSKFRLIGYDTKMITAEEFEDDSTDAGEIGSGLTVVALYELELNANASGKFADFEVKYKTTSDVSDSVMLTVEENGGNISTSDQQFISCVAEYGLLLRNSQFKGTASFASIIERLNDLSFEDDLYKKDFVTIVGKASEIY